MFISLFSQETLRPTNMAAKATPYAHTQYQDSVTHTHTHQNTVRHIKFFRIILISALIKKQTEVKKNASLYTFLSFF